MISVPEDERRDGKSVVGKQGSVIRAIRRSAAFEQARASLWLTPAIFVGGAGVAAAALSRVDINESSVLGDLVFPGGADSARAILQAIAGSVITVTGVVFSLTVVTLQLASTQFSPRLLRTFLRDVSNQIVLGTFLATFAYALLVLRAVKSGANPEDDVVPALAVTGAYVLTAASVVALVYFIDHIARSIRIDSLMREVNEDTAEAIDDLAPRHADGGTPVPRPVPPPHADVVAAPRSGFVQAVDEARLLRSAETAGVVVVIEPRVGDRVVAGGPLARVWAEQPDQRIPHHVAGEVAAAVRIGYERTLQQDIAFGFRQLVDIAVKALSPGVNDPTTAVHAMGHLAALLVRVAERRLGPRVLDRSGTGGTVIVPAFDLADYLNLACGQIRRYGAGEPVVMAELLTMIRDVARLELTKTDHHALRREVDLTITAAERATADARDLGEVQALATEVRSLLRQAPDANG